MDESLRGNRDVWDVWTRIHVAPDFYDVASFKSGERGNRLRDYEIEEVGDVSGKTLLHMQCHFGLDTRSWARLGAIVTGADFSGESIAAARALATEVGLPATFVVSNVRERHAARQRIDGPPLSYATTGSVRPRKAGPTTCDWAAGELGRAWNDAHTPRDGRAGPSRRD